MYTRTYEDHGEETTTVVEFGARMKDNSQKSTLDQSMAKLIKQVHVDGITSDECPQSEMEARRSQSPRQQAVTRPPRHTSSKYDFVKVRVWLGDNSDHYYVLSRFLVSRMLTVTKIPHHVAIKIALELKKLLIDNTLLDVSQSDLETNLFKLMDRRGYGAEYINRYKMMTRFHHQRTPLIILVCGAACVGKSTIATQLAQRLNLPNVLQTDMVYELLRTVTDAPLATLPVWAREFSTPEELITEFCRECRIVRKGLDGDLTKAMKDGKPVIIEGFHLDPALYLLEKDNGAVAASHEKANETDTSPLTNSEPEIAKLSTCPPNSEQETSHALKAMVEDGNCNPYSKRETRISSEGESARSDGGNGAAGKEVDRDHEGQNKEHRDGQHVKPPAKAIVVPIVLRMADLDHQVLLEEWIASRSVDGTETLEEEEALIAKFRIIQDYLSSFESQGLKVVDISATTFPQTLDGLHNYLLQCIEQGCNTTPDITDD